MFVVGGPEAGLLAVIPLLLWALVVAAVCWAVRTGVRHGLLDADRRRKPPGPSAGPASGGPAHGGE